MSALQAPTRPIVAVLPGPGWCTACAAAGEQRPAVDPRSGRVCRDHLRLLPPRPALPGQLELVDAVPVPKLLQAEYPTGVRVACSPCAVAGRDELGLPYRFADDATPLCLACWRARERRAGRRGQAAETEVEWVDELPAGCAACGSPDPSPACWLCGFSWLADARAEHELLQQTEQAAVDVEFERLAVRELAAQRVVWLTGWVSRLHDVLAAYADPGRRGSTVSPRWGRAVELLADVLARDAAAHPGGRGRPSVFRMVAAVMAVDADFRTGRRAMPGRAGCAELAGVCERAVSSAWARGVSIGAWIRTTAGRRLSLDERMATGRGNDRAVYDLRPVHRSTDPAARDAMIPAALQAVDELLGWGQQLLIDAEHALDQLHSPTRGTGRAPDADTIARRAARVRLRHAVTRARTAATVLASHLSTANMCTPHTVSKGECVSSCLRGCASTFVDRRNQAAGRRPRRGRGDSKGGASRSSTRNSSADLERGGFVGGRPDGTHPASRPRTLFRMSPGSPDNDGFGLKVTAGQAPRRRRRPPEWHDWAYPLAHRLRELWPWLRDQPLHLVAATLGARLGPRWTAADVVDFCDQDRAGRPLPVALHTPIGMLRDMLDQALTGRQQPPHPARRHDEHQRALAQLRQAAAVAEATERNAAAEKARAEHASRGAAGDHARAGGVAQARAALAAARSRRAGGGTAG